MPIINVPGVGQVKFPDDMSDKDIISAIQNNILKTPKEEPGVKDYLKDLPKAVGRGAVGLLETAGIGASALLPEEYEQKARAGIGSIAAPAQQYLAPSSQEVGESVSSTLASGIGSTAPFFALGPLGLLGRAGAGALGVAAGAGEARQEAERAGATAEERSKATMLGAPTGLLDLIAPNIGPLKSIFTTALARGGVEGLTEAAQKTAQNLIAKGVYDPSKDVLAGTAEEGAYGAGVGALTSLLIDVALGRRAKGGGPKPEATPEAPAQAPAEAAPEAPPAPSLETLPPGAATPDEQAEAYRMLSQMEQDRQARAQQALADQEEMIAQAQRDRLERAPEIARGMPGFTGMPDENAAMMGAIRQRQEEERLRQEQERAAEEERQVAEQLTAEKERQAEIRRIQQTTFSADPVQNQIVKQRLLDQLAEKEAAKVVTVTSPTEEPAGLFPKGEPIIKEPQRKPAQAKKYTPEEQEEANSIRGVLADINKQLKEAKAEKGNLFNILKGRLIERPGAFSLNDIAPDDKSLRGLVNKEDKGDLLEDLVADGALDDYLPFRNRKNINGAENPNFDDQAALQHIADKLANKDYSSESAKDNIRILEEQRDAYKTQLERFQGLPEVKLELDRLQRQQKAEQVEPVSLQDLIDDARYSGVDVDALEQDVKQQMPDATPEQYQGALRYALNAATSKSPSYEIGGIDYSKEEIESLIGERFTEDEINELIAQAEAQQAAVTRPAKVSQPRAEISAPVKRTTEVKPSATEVKTEKRKAEQPPTLTAPPGFKAKKGRNEQVVLAARELAAGRITKKQYDEYVDYYMPIEPVLGDKLEAPIEGSLMRDILTTKIKQKKNAALVDTPVNDGVRVGLRMDIPALEWGRQNGVNGSVVAIHRGTSPDTKTTGPNISYKSTGHITNVVFAPRSEEKSFGIAQGLEGPAGEKTPQQTIEGNWVNTSPEETFKRVQSLLNDPNWKQISLDPLRHSFFYDRSNRRPVVSADEVLQVGRFVLAKNPVYAERESFMYSQNPDIGTDNLNPADFSDVKNAKELLEQYLKVGKDSGLKELASLLLQSKRLKDIDVIFVKEGDVPKHADVAASLNANAIAVTHTDKTGSRIYYRADKPNTFNESTLVHEVFHGMTEAALERNPTLRRELVNMTREMRIGLRDFEYLTNKGTDKNLSEFWNIAVRDKPGEMLAYAMTSPAFRQVFSNMAANGRPFQSLSYQDTENLRVRKEKPVAPGEKPTAPKGLTAWQRIVDFVRRLFGIAPANQKKFEQALIDYQENLKRHEEAKDLYDKQLKEYNSISPLKGKLDNYLKQLIADTEAAGVAMPQGETVSQVAKQPWGERESPDAYGREKTLTRMYNRMRDAYDEGYGPDEAYEAAYENATKAEQYILRQLKKDDFLGFDYPHQAIRAIIEDPDAYEMSSGLKAAISRLGNNYIVSSAIFGGKEAAPTRTQTGEDALEILSGMGRAVKEPEPGYVAKARQAWDNAVDNPKLAKEQSMGAFRRWTDQFETWAFSSDAALNNQIRREVMDSMKGQEEKIGILLNASLSQTVHSDAVANLFLMKGNVKYDNELHKWVGVDDKSNIFNLSKQLDEIAQKHGLTKEEIELIAHTAFEAKRTKSLIRENEAIEARVAAMRAEARRIRGNSPVAASELSDKASKLLQKVKVIHMTQEDIAAGMSQFELFPELSQVVETWNGIRENALDVMVETGLYSRDEAENLLANADYVPFFREEQIEEGKGPKEFLRSLSVQADKRMKGSKKPVNDIFDNMVRWTQYAVNRGVRNRSALALVDTAGELKLGEKVTGPKDGENVVRVWRNGEQEYHSMADPMFVTAFRGLESVAIPTVKFFSKFADTLRQSVVLFPLFSVSQVTQDSFAAMFSSGLKPQHALSIPFRAVKEFIQTLRGKSSTHEELKNVGAVGVRDFTSAIIRSDVEVLAGLKKDKSLWDTVKRSLGSVAMAADNAVRQATYEAALAQGMSKAEAIEKAFEIFNVRRRGSSQMLAMAGQVIPFFNAYLAAQNVAYRTLTGVGVSPTDRKAALQTLAATTGSVMALSMLYAMMMGDDEDYEKKPTPTRDRLLMIPGSGGLGIPLRADAFVLPKVLAEHTYHLITENGMTDGAKFRASLASLLANSVLSPTVVPQAVKPITEAVLNYDFFQQKPLVGIYQAKKDLSRQFEDSTSEFSKVLGKTELISPIVADHVIRGMFGSFGGLFLQVTNPLIAEMAGVTRPSMTLRDAANAIPNASAFISKEYEVGLRKDFYALKEVTDRAAATLSDMKARSPHEIEAYLSDPEVRQRVAMAPVVNRISNQLTDIRKKVNLITNVETKEMTDDRKEELIKQLREQEYQLLKNVNLRKLREMAQM